jgi:hypothetical protein
MIFRLCPSAAYGRRHCLLLVRADTTSQAAGLPTFKFARQQSGLRQNRKQQRSMSSSMSGSFSASSSNSAFNKPAGFCPASGENESSTEFQNGERNQFPNALENLAENKAVSVKNSAL